MSGDWKYKRLIGYEQPKNMNGQTAKAAVRVRTLGITIPGLTDRHLDILKGIALGLPNKRIAADCGVTIRTLDKQRQDLIAVTGRNTTAGLTMLALKLNLVELK